MKLIQMIRDNIAIQRAYKKRNRKQTSPNAFWIAIHAEAEDDGD